VRAPRRGPSLIVALLGGALACASGPSYREIAPTLAPLAAGQGRLVLYMTQAAEVGSFLPTLTVDGLPVGRLRVNTFRSVDRPAGPHEVGVQMEPYLSAFGNQAPTPPRAVDVEAGETSYLEVLVLADAAGIQVLLRPHEAAEAERELAPLVEAPDAD
jgi:hypothetical protein